MTKEITSMYALDKEQVRNIVSKAAESISDLATDSIWLLYQAAGAELRKAVLKANGTEELCDELSDTYLYPVYEATEKAVADRFTNFDDELFDEVKDLILGVKKVAL